MRSYCKRRMSSKNYKQIFTNKCMINMKRGQVAIYIIAAIVIVALVVLGVSFYPRLGGIFSQEISPNTYLKNCIEPEIKPAVEILSKQGGYRNPDGLIEYNGKKIKYLCYTSENYKTCNVQQPMIKSNFEKELNNVIKPKADQCARNLISEYGKRGFRVISSSVSSRVEIVPEKIKVVISAPMTITKDSTQTFNEFEVNIGSEMYNLLFTASSIIDYEASLGDSATELYLQYYPDLKIEKTKLSDGTKIYRLSNVVTNEEFVFASRSLAWPAGYGLEG